MRTKTARLNTGDRVSWKYGTKTHTGTVKERWPYKRLLVVMDTTRSDGSENVAVIGETDATTITE